MFKRSDRLTRAEFTKYFVVGRRVHTPFATFILSPLPEGVKVAVVVGKKVAKRAVMRNTVRRRVYALLRQAVLASGYQGVLIVITKPAIATLPRLALVDVLRTAFASLLKNT